jgi:anti-sigma factor RsiW
MNEKITTEPAPQPDDQLLVTYLDGELDAAASDDVERRLADEPSLRARLQTLMGAWDMLDHLPRATVDDSFAHTTVAMVAMKAAEQLDSQARGSDTGAWMLGGIVLLAAVAFGFRWGGTLSPGENERLIRDLPVIERFDQYRHVDDFDFVRRLHERKLFSAEHDTSVTEDRDGE